MARGLPTDLDEAVLSGVRRPAWEVTIYDLRSTASNTTPTTIQDVVLGNALPSSVGPTDVTDRIESVSITETAGDYVRSGIAATQVQAILLDGDVTYDPLLTSSTLLKAGNVIRIREGDEGAASSGWPITFTGVLVGQPGVTIVRAPNPKRAIQIQALSRENLFLRREITTQAYVRGTAYSAVIDDIAQAKMGLDSAETDFPTFGVRTTAHEPVQLIDIAPLTGLAQFMLADGFMPRFDGEGKLGATSGIITKAPTRVYAERDLLRRVDRPPVTEDAPNEVIVHGLDENLSKITSPETVLATAGITTGFFAKSSSIPVKWSDDGLQQAENTRLRTLQSVNGGLLPVGSETYVENTDADGLARSGSVNVTTGFDPSLIILITVAYIAEAKIPDTSLPFGGPTIPVGRIIQAITVSAVSSIMASMGKGEYEILGVPVEMIYAELEAIARVSGTPAGERSEIEIENHLLTTQSLCDSVALRTLRRLRAQANQRKVEMIYDPALEPDDVFEYTDEQGTARRLMIQSIRRELKRGTAGLAQLSCFEVTTGVRP